VTFSSKWKRNNFHQEGHAYSCPSFLSTKGYAVTKSELIELLAKKQPHLAQKDVEVAVKCIIDQMSEALSANERIEIRGFGSFLLHHRSPRMGRNPKTGDAVALTEKYVPHFKPGKELRDRVDAAKEKHKIVG
jgi:integration host factor subunit beta